MGPLSGHMLQHIVLMNAVAPAAMLLLRSHGVRLQGQGWPVATAAQLVVLWLWHAPPFFEAAMAEPALMAAMHLSLALSACWFWLSVFSLDATQKWQGIVAILLTGKLFCLLGALLAFAPRALYQLSCISDLCLDGSSASGLADQQMAGSMMLIACPMSYVVIGTVMAARWFLDLERQASTHG